MSNKDYHLRVAIENAALSATSRSGKKNTALAIKFARAFPVGEIISLEDFDKWAAKHHIYYSKGQNKLDACNLSNQRGVLRERINTSANCETYKNVGEKPPYQIYSGVKPKTYYIGGDEAIAKHEIAEVQRVVAKASLKALTAAKNTATFRDGIYLDTELSERRAESVKAMVAIADALRNINADSQQDFDSAINTIKSIVNADPASQGTLPKPDDEESQ